jgi:hypothetical protein
VVWLVSHLKATWPPNANLTQPPQWCAPWGGRGGSQRHPYTGVRTQLASTPPTTSAYSTRRWKNTSRGYATPFLLETLRGRATQPMRQAPAPPDRSHQPRRRRHHHRGLRRLGHTTDLATAGFTPMGAGWRSSKPLRRSSCGTGPNRPQLRVHCSGVSRLRLGGPSPPPPERAVFHEALFGCWASA